MRRYFRVEHWGAGVAALASMYGASYLMQGRPRAIRLTVGVALVLLIAGAVYLLLHRLFRRVS